jgi:hypothetical protein
MRISNHFSGELQEREHISTPGSSRSLRLATVRTSLWLAERARVLEPFANPEGCRDKGKPEAYPTTYGGGATMRFKFVKIGPDYFYLATLGREVKNCLCCCFARRFLRIGCLRS